MPPKSKTPCEILRIVRFLMLFWWWNQCTSLEGVWRSQGYAYIFEIRGAGLKAFEITTTTRVLGFTAQLQRVAAAGREATFKSRDEGVSFVRTGGTNDHKLLHQEEAVPDIRIDRIESLPAVCEHLTADTPLNNFEVFVRTWAEQYMPSNIYRLSAGMRLGRGLSRSIDPK
jgi:hypothetical protein